MAKKVFKTGTFTYDAVVYGVTNMETSKTAGEVDVTDTQTVGNEREYLAGRQERTLSIEMWKDVTEVDPDLGVVLAAELDFEGFTYAGDVLLLEITMRAVIDDGVQLSASGRFSGTVVETPEP